MNQGSDNGTPMINEQYKYSDLTGKIIGCAMRVHSALGNGFQELIYQRAMEIEMADAGLSFSREHEMPVYYKNRQVGTRRADFLVEGVISVELKAIIQLEDVHLAQAINYLEAYDLEVGLLINFGARSLQQKRLQNKKFNQEKQGNPHVKRRQGEDNNQGDSNSAKPKF
jgi:GxxExxY protein